MTFSDKNLGIKIYRHLLLGLLVDVGFIKKDAQPTGQGKIFEEEQNRLENGYKRKILLQTKVWNYSWNRFFESNP